MTSNVKDQASRHGKRAAGSVVIAFPCPQAIKKMMQQAASKDGYGNLSELYRDITRNYLRRRNAALRRVAQ